MVKHNLGYMPQSVDAFVVQYPQYQYISNQVKNDIIAAVQSGDEAKAEELVKLAEKTFPTIFTELTPDQEPIIERVRERAKNPFIITIDELVRDTINTMQQPSVSPDSAAPKKLGVGTLAVIGLFALTMLS